MSKETSVRTITEPAREIRVCREVDVAVVGGGPGGVGSAIAAARSGARTVLIERYGHLGGMATGGLVNIIPNLSDISGRQHLFGLNQEILDRVDARGGASYPKKEHWGTADKKIVDYYLNANLQWFYIRHDHNTGKQRVLYTAVFFESKSGRQAILAKVVIDATGDGDIFVAAGADFDNRTDPGLRISMAAMVFWVANVDIKRLEDFQKSQPDKYQELMQELEKRGGFPRHFKGVLENQPGVIWAHPFLPCPDQKDVEDLTRTDISGRKKVLITGEFLKKYVPGFEKSFIMLTSPQLGTQGGRRVIGEYIMTPRDLETDEVFEDTIAVLANNDNGEISARHPTVCIPYRCLVPLKVEGLLVACRAFSSVDAFNHQFNIIPHCIAYGQAAGTAAAMAAKAGVPPRNVDYKALRKNLVRQGVNLPDIK
jgi:hypothetical protein